MIGATVFTTNDDLLRNVSTFSRKCLVCGKWHRVEVEQQVDVVWIGCECMHVFSINNSTKWQ